ncbi:ABC transporter permease [Melioribacteraceae bacterium 4301-Me]|uniref:ABC transporter permease n=1 Tax=Pyranulibacter aquaticus TaxID=3163344 RepID=UPI003598C2D9
MKNILTITQLTINEALARKNFIMLSLISTFVLLIILGIFASTDVNGLIGSIKIEGENFNGDMLMQLSHFFRLIIIMPLFAGGLFLSIFSVSSFIPHLLEKGNIDIFLSKPISRAQLILGKYLGGIIVVLVNVFYLVVGIWILTGWKFGDWNVSFLFTAVSITYAFSVLYALIILIGIITQSSILAMMLSYLIFFVFSPLLVDRQRIVNFFGGGSLLKTVLEALYYLVPQTADLGTLTRNIAVNNSVNTFLPIYVSFIFIVLILSLSIIIFNKKDY